MALSISEPADQGSVNIASSTVVDGTSTITIQPYKTTEGTWIWYNFDIGGANTRTPIIDILSTDYFNGAPDVGALHGTWSYDDINWFNFDNVSFPGSPARIRLSNNAAFNQATVHVAHRATFTLARMQAQIATWLASSYVAPCASADSNGVLTTLGSVSSGFGKTCPAAEVYGLEITDPTAGNPKNKGVLIHPSHVSEMPGTYAFLEFVDFLVSADPRAAFLRKYWTFYVYPDTNPQGRYGGLSRTRPGSTTTLGRFWSNTPADDWDMIENVLQPAIISDTGGAVNLFLDWHSYNHDYGNNTNYQSFSNGVDDYEHNAYEVAMKNHIPDHFFWVASVQSNTPPGWANAVLDVSGSMRVCMALEVGNSKTHGVPEYRKFGRHLLYALAHGTERGMFPIQATDLAGRVYFT